MKFLIIVALGIHLSHNIVLATNTSSFRGASDTIDNASKSRRLNIGTPCFNNYWTVNVPSCSYIELVNVVPQSCLMDLFGPNPQLFVDNVCQRDFINSAMPFEHIIEKTDRSFYKEYFDGNTFLNTERQTKDIYGATIHRLDSTAARIDDVYKDVAQSMGITAPDYVSSFDPEKCKLRAAMCCFVQDRQANNDDVNGNCAEQYDDQCVNADPADNTDLCYSDAARAPSSPHVAGGFGIFSGDNDEGEGNVHCHGMAWSSNQIDLSAVYRGNNLFYISMYDHLYVRGYVRNVPLAPMCGCVEMMPTVSRSDCTEMEVNGVVTFQYENGRLTADYADVNIVFAECKGVNDNNNNLDAYYERLMNEDKASIDELNELREKYLVGDGNCEEHIDAFLMSKGLERG